MAPVGVDPRIQQLFSQGSMIFRIFDTDFSGTLKPKEFRNAMRHNGYNIPEFELDRMFAMVDTDRSGRLSEREFCEFWVYSHGGGTPGGF